MWSDSWCLMFCIYVRSGIHGPERYVAWKTLLWNPNDGRGDGGRMGVR
jgi:hypothetical protein